LNTTVIKNSDQNGYFLFYIISLKVMDVQLVPNLSRDSKFKMKPLPNLHSVLKAVIQSVRVCLMIQLTSRIVNNIKIFIKIIKNVRNVQGSLF